MDTLELILSMLSSQFPTYPIYRAGSYTEDDDWPTVFITFWQWTGRGVTFYDNQLYSSTMEFDINIYGSDVQAVYDAIESCVGLFKENSFNIVNYTRDRPSGRPDYIGQGITIQYIVRQDISLKQPKI